MPRGKNTVLKISTKTLKFGEVKLNEYFHSDGIYWQKNDPKCARAFAHYLNEAGMPFKGFDDEQVVHEVVELIQ